MRLQMGVITICSISPVVQQAHMYMTELSNALYQMQLANPQQLQLILYATNSMCNAACTSHRAASHSAAAS